MKSILQPTIFNIEDKVNVFYSVTIFMVNDFYNLSGNLGSPHFLQEAKEMSYQNRSVGSKVGIGLDPDGFSSSLDLMKTAGVF